MQLSLYSIILLILVLLSILLVLTNIHFRDYKATKINSIFTLILLWLFAMSIEA